MLKNIIGKVPQRLTQSLTAFYHEKVIDHYENPRNVGSLDKSKKNVGTGLVGAPACGDVMKLQIELNEDGTTINRAVFKVFLDLSRPSDVVQLLLPAHTLLNSSRVWKSKRLSKSKTQISLATSNSLRSSSTARCWQRRPSRKQSRTSRPRTDRQDNELIWLLHPLYDPPSFLYNQWNFTKKSRLFYAFWS